MSLYYKKLLKLMIDRDMKKKELKQITGLSYTTISKLEKGENADPQAAALRELEEEIGYTADLELLYDFYSAIGFCNERIKLYGATNLKKVENPRPQDADETLELLEVTLKEAKNLIQTGEICDAKTIMAIQYWDLINK